MTVLNSLALSVIVLNEVLKQVNSLLSLDLVDFDQILKHKRCTNTDVRHRWEQSLAPLITIPPDQIKQNHQQQGCPSGQDSHVRIRYGGLVWVFMFT